MFYVFDKIFEFLAKLFPDVVICRNSFDKSSLVLYTAEFCVFITSLILNEFLCIFNNVLAEDVLGV